MGEQYNYRIAWTFSKGYYPQWHDGSKWVDLIGKGSGEQDARLTCKLAARMAEEECRLDPIVHKPEDER
jgi:hypothetical protein